MGKYVLAAVLVSSLLTLFLLPVRKGLRRFVGSIGVYALWLFVAISLLLPFPQMVYKAVAGRELFQQQSKFSVMNLVDLAQKNQKAVDNKSENEYNSVKKTSLSTGETAQNKLSQQGDIIDESSRTDPARLKEEEVQTWKDYVKTYGLYEIWLLGFLLKFLDRNNSGLSVMFSSNIDESNPTWNAQELASNGKSINMECNQ